MNELLFYTDGSCIGNPGPGGWAFLYLNDAKVIYEASGSELNTTNNRMEMMAAIEALSYAAKNNYKNITVCTDSKYVMDGISSWITKWKSNSWKTAAKKPVKNMDLWKVLDSLNLSMNVNWNWVKGHSEDLFNNRVDELANLAAQKAL
jgi:ribonuclease HI